MAAHELRAPITGLVGYLETLRKKIKPGAIPEVDEDLDQRREQQHGAEHR